MQTPQRARTWFSERIGDAVAGVLVRIEERFDKNNKTHDVAVLRDSGGVEWGVWLFRPGIGWQWDRSDPVPGDQVVVCRIADREHKGRSYSDFQVEVLSAAKPTRSDSRAVDLDDGNPF